MQITIDTRKIVEEIRQTPAWAKVAAVLVFLLAEVLLQVLSRRGGPPFWGALYLGTMLGLFTGWWTLLIGYVNYDAKRRRLSRSLWTLIALIVPWGLGALLYMLVRAPLPESCPECHATVESGFNYCPKCSCQLRPACPYCQRAVHAGDLHCPHCGKRLNGSVVDSRLARAQS
jgi:hypothetical protein